MATGNAAATETAAVVVVAAAAPAVAFALPGVVPPLVTAIIALHRGSKFGGPHGLRFTPCVPPYLPAHRSSLPR
eukprot:5116144-Prymnesium_polylepis.1